MNHLSFHCLYKLTQNRIHLFINDCDQMFVLDKEMNAEMIIWVQIHLLSLSFYGLVLHHCLSRDQWLEKSLNKWCGMGFLSHVGTVNMVRIGPYEQSFKLSSIIARYKLWWLKRTRSSQRNIPCSDQPTHVQIKWERNYILLWNTNQSCLLHPFTIRMYYNARL